MQTREATQVEIIDSLARSIRHGWQVSYRHFTKEIYNPRAKNGVSHRNQSRSKVSVIDGKPFVRYNGKLEEITGTFCTLETGQTFVGDLRIKSPYLS